jgi:hypothetical protein
MERKVVVVIVGDAAGAILALFRSQPEYELDRNFGLGCEGLRVVQMLLNKIDGALAMVYSLSPPERTGRRSDRNYALLSSL